MPVITGTPGHTVIVYRVFEALDALVTVVEEARGVPMTSTCVVPRGDVLDLLDDLRESVPAELDDAQDVLDHRDELIARAEQEGRDRTEQARAEAERLVAEARAEAEQLLADAAHRAERSVADGRAQGQELIDRGRAEGERLIETGRQHYEHSVAEGRAEQVRLVAQTEIVQAAHIESGRIIDAGEREAMRLRGECDSYVEGTLAEFQETLTRTLQTVQRGRGSWAQRRAEPVAAAGLRDLADRA
jgi:cell division septum initiation protein DivIVA